MRLKRASAHKSGIQEKIGKKGTEQRNPAKGSSPSNRLQT